MKCDNCKYLELVQLYHLFGAMANCEHPDSKLDPETSKVEELNNCLLFENKAQRVPILQ